ncbi:MAG TPA: hypothetical protein VGJ51_19635, partial [Candidatus Angelobacter sp.]
MNNAKPLLFLLLVISLTAAHAQTAQPSAPKTAPAPDKPSTGVATSWQKVPIPALHQFKPQEPRRVQLPNGMVIFLQEDHELPLIDGTIRIRGGSREEPAGKVGMISLYSEVWRTG